MKIFAALALPVLFASPCLAQTQLVRGDVDGIQNTNRWRLECTSIELVSRTVDLKVLHDASRQQDIEYEMQVSVVSLSPPVLDVVSAKQIPQIFDMGNIRLGRADRWHVLGNQGEIAVVYLTGDGMTAYQPLGSLGTWLLSPGFFFNAGVVSAQGRFEFNVQPPNDPRLVGLTFVGQAAVVAPSTGRVLIANAQCKQVRAN